MRINLIDAYKSDFYGEYYLDVYRSLDTRQKVISVAFTAFSTLAAYLASLYILGPVHLVTAISCTAAPLTSLSATGMFEWISRHIIGNFSEDRTIKFGLLITAVTAVAALVFCSPLQVSSYISRLFCIYVVHASLSSITEVFRRNNCAPDEGKNRELITHLDSNQNFGDFTDLPPPILASILVPLRRDAAIFALVNKSFNNFIKTEVFQTEFKAKICPNHFGKRQWKEFLKIKPGPETAIPLHMIVRYNSEKHSLTFIPKKVTFLESGKSKSLTLGLILKLFKVNHNIHEVNKARNSVPYESHWVMFGNERAKVPPRRRNFKESIDVPIHRDNYGRKLGHFFVSEGRNNPFAKYRFCRLDQLPTEELSRFVEEQKGKLPETHDALIAICTEVARTGKSVYEKVKPSLERDLIDEGGLRTRLPHPQWSQWVISWSAEEGVSLRSIHSNIKVVTDLCLT